MKQHKPIYCSEPETPCQDCPVATEKRDCKELPIDTGSHRVGVLTKGPHAGQSSLNILTTPEVVETLNRLQEAMQLHKRGDALEAIVRYAAETWPRIALIRAEKIAQY